MELKDKIKQKFLEENKNFSYESRRYTYSYTKKWMRTKQNRLGRMKWNEIKEKYGNKCLRCKKSGDEVMLTADHVIPLSMGGDLSYDNVQPLCKVCNSIKRRSNIDYRQVI